MCTDITILRLGHRLPRDERTTTHVALVARAFGAGRMVYSGQKDSGLECSVSRLVKSWGGDFSVRYEKNFRKIISECRGNNYVVVHLTMYGIPLPESLPTLKTQDTRLLVIVGAESVPAEVYQLADFNIAITSQPHSEVAALAVFLDRLLDGSVLNRNFAERFSGKLRICPSEKGKNFNPRKD
jgi:tRNA (cytidine56-2'-O)-methyltransferase